MVPAITDDSPMKPRATPQRMRMPLTNSPKEKQHQPVVGGLTSVLKECGYDVIFS
jgi:hypothetical protein